jgi:p-aminobenzoyl-glutamate transporter AbgT
MLLLVVWTLLGLPVGPGAPLYLGDRAVPSGG